MVKIEFTEPSTGKVDSGETALEINQDGDGAAIMAISKKNTGIIVEAGEVFGQRGIGVYAVGQGENATGIEGKGEKGIGVKGTSSYHYGVFGICSAADGAGVCGQALAKGVAVLGYADDEATGVKGMARKIGVHGEATRGDGAGVEGVNTNTQKGIGVLGRGKTAGRFEGNVEVTGDIQLLNADCAEDFDIVEENIEAGTVMVLNKMGSLQPSYQEYDRKVAGIISGATGYKPAIVLDRQQPPKYSDRLPISLMGKTYCKVDANHSPIEIGDLLTTSSTKGYAMKADDPAKSFGAVIGKALGSIKQGLGTIPVLVTLQ
jgi:hypothetical protein